MIIAQAIAPESARARGLELALAAARVAEENRGREIVILDTCGVTSMFDFFVIVTGTSSRQLHAMADEINRTLKKDFGERRLGVEGYERSQWVLLDYGNVVVHLFDAPTREYYDLEGLWAAAKPIAFAPSPSAGAAAAGGA